MTREFSRRSLLAAGCTGYGAMSLARPAAFSPSESSLLSGADFGDPIRYNGPTQTVLGDTWSCAWSDDDHLYCVIDDTAGFDMVLRPSRDRNVAIGSFGATRPPDLHGTMVNGMEAFGRSNQLGVDGACWKGNGITSVDGVLYLSVSRHWYHVKEYDRRQISRNASILKSEDKGRTWSPTPYQAEPLPDPLFPGPRFATPFFLDVGRDSRPVAPAPHETDAYVYAVSTDGYWDNGNSLHLARAPREVLAKQELKHWEFFCGLREEEESPVWRAGKAGLDACYPILSRPFSFGQTGMTYVAPLRRFLLVGWRYPRLERETWNVRTSVWDLYEAPAPWGPWRRFASKEWDTGLYNPTLPTRFISSDGLHLWALTCGCFDTWGDPPDKTLYTLLMMPISLRMA